MALPPNIVHDRWLSQWMRRPCYQLRSGPLESVSGEIGTLLEGDAFLFAKTATTDITALGALQRVGFQLIETQIQLEAAPRMPARDTTVTVRAARDGDEAALEAIARSAFRFTRFHLDAAIDREVASEIKAQWVKNFFRGKRGQILVVAECEGVVCGFNQLLVQDAGATLVIDLIGVADGFRGRGVAEAMIRHGAQCARSASLYRVATQIVNVPSLRLYEKLGFRVRDSQYVLHAHGRDANAKVADSALGT